MIFNSKAIIVMIIFMCSILGVKAQTTEYIKISEDKPVLASSTYSKEYDPSNATDYFATSVWGSETSPTTQWIYIDLQEVKQVNRVVLNWYDPYYATSFETAVSNDAVTWTFIDKTTNGTGGTNTIETTASGRYVGVLLTGKNDIAYGLRDISVYTALIPPMVKTKKFGGNGKDTLTFIKRFENMGYLVGGFSDSTDIPGLENSPGKTYLALLNDHLDIVWQKKLNVGSSITDATRMVTGDILISYDDGYVLQINPSGDIIGQKKYGLHVSSAQQLTDGTIMVCQGDAWSVVDSSGAVISIHSNEAYGVKQVRPVSGSRFAFVGPNKVDPWVSPTAYDYGILQPDMTIEWGINYNQIPGRAEAVELEMVYEAAYIIDYNYVLDQSGVHYDVTVKYFMTNGQVIGEGPNASIQATRFYVSQWGQEPPTVDMTVNKKGVVYARANNELYFDNIIPSDFNLRPEGTLTAVNMTPEDIQIDPDENLLTIGTLDNEFCIMTYDQALFRK